MLTELSIDNFAIIDRVEVEFGPGMTVLSGETGAGKSILVDALGLLLGDRAGADVVRAGSNKAAISARFDLADTPDAAAWLAEHELADDDGECVLRRVIGREGRSRCWINAQPVPARSLRSLGAYLVDILGQHAHQRLARAAVQRATVDEYGGHESLVAEVGEIAAAIRTNRDAIAAIEQTDEDGAMRADILRYQIQELDDTLIAGESISNLEAEQRRLGSAERLIEDGQRALAALTDAESGGATDQLSTAERVLADLAETDAGFSEAAELAASARIQADESADGLRRHLDRVNIDPQRLAHIDDRLATLADLARKHRCQASELTDRREALAVELEALENAGKRLTELKVEAETLASRYREKADELTAKRGAAADALGQDVTAILDSLGMAEAAFTIAVQPSDGAGHVSPHGVDRIAFEVATNPGQAPRPIERVASGGELSRLGLAIEVAAASGNRVPTMVFDEVDAGIGGGAAEIVGRQLQVLGENGQSLCVTHLPQVAAQASQQFAVSKSSDAATTTAVIEPLTEADRVEEVARMLGGVEITDQTRAHATDMLARANMA